MYHTSVPSYALHYADDKMGLRSWFRNKKNTFAQKHLTLLKARDKLIWFLFHLNRGKGFWNQWLDLFKFVAYVLVALASLKILGMEMNLTNEILYIIGIWLTIGLLALFLITSQLMDFVRWQEAETEQVNTRNELAKEIRAWLNNSAK